MVVIDNEPLTWNVAKIEIDNDTEKGKQILNLLTKLEIIGVIATKKNITSYIAKHNPKLLFFNGHDDESRIAGYENEIIIEVSQNVEQLVGKIIYVRSCAVAVNLGKASIQKGALAFIGYTKKYTLCTSSASQSRPMQDRVAQLFLLPSNLIPIALIKGNTAKEAYIKSKKSMIRRIRFMLSTNHLKGKKMLFLICGQIENIRFC